MKYTPEMIQSAMPHIFDVLETPPQPEREAGMPGKAKDPRTANDPIIYMIDIRRAWEHCEWLSYEQRQAILAYALCGTYRAASFFTDVPIMTLQGRAEAGLELMSQWLGTTQVERDEMLAEALKPREYKQMK